MTFAKSGVTAYFGYSGKTFVSMDGRWIIKNWQVCVKQ